MSKQKKIASVLIALLAWTTLGALLGAAGGYVVYVRQPAVFQSEGAIQIAVSKPESDASSDGEPLNGSNLITSSAILTKAAAAGRLGRLTGIAGGKPIDVAKGIRDSGNLQVIEDTPDAFGAVFLVRFQGATPSSTQQVVQSVLDATVDSLTEVDNTANWDESIELLTKTRGEIELAISQLKEQQENLGDSDVTTVDGEFVSASATRYRRLNAEAEQLQRVRDALSQKIRRVESMIENGAPIDVVLSNLDIPIVPLVTKPAAPKKRVPASGPKKSKADDAEKRQLARRIAMERKIQESLQPLIEERTELLKKVGRRHPKVLSVQEQIDELQQSLDELSPLLPGSTPGSQLRTDEPESTPAPKPESSREPEPDAAATNQDDAESARKAELGGKVMSSLRSLQAEKRKIDEDFERVSNELEQAANEFARDKINAAERSRIQAELGTQTNLLTEAARRLTQLSSQSPFPTVRVAVLREPGAGEQIAPELMPLLVRGCQIGLVVGLVLVSLLYLASLAASE